MKTLTALLLALWFSSAALLSAAPFRLSYSIVGPPVAGVWMTYETGAFKRYGLDVQLVYIPSSVTNIQALLGGSLDVAVPGISGVVLAAARGASVVAVTATMNRPPMSPLRAAGDWPRSASRDSTPLPIPSRRSFCANWG